MAIGARELRERIATYTINQWLSAGGGWRRRFWAGLKALLVRIAADPACKVVIHGRPMWLPLSHALPSYLRDYPAYDSLPGRLGQFVRGRYGYLSCIDVGANVGDTIAAFHPEPGDRFLAIEPNPKYVHCLKRNFGPPLVEIYEGIAAGEDFRAEVTLLEKSGTASARLTVVDHGGAQVWSLDSILEGRPNFGRANVLKIDTDGSDFAVVDGARRVILSAQPAVLVECDQFSNKSYIEGIARLLAYLESAGLGRFLIYDNLGYLLGSAEACKPNAFFDLVFYQLTSPFFYFDLLFMKPGDAREFLKSERSFFSSRAEGQASLAAREISELLAKE